MTDPRVNVPITGDRKSIPGFPGEALPAVGDYWSTNALEVGEETIPRVVGATSNVAMTSGMLRIAYLTARKAETATQIRLFTATTAAVSATLIRAGVWTADLDGALLALVASTPNDTTIMGSAFTTYAKAFSAGFSKVIGQRYAVGLLTVTTVTAPTVPSSGGSTPAPEAGFRPRICGTISSLADLPATAAAGTVVASINVPYFVISP